MTITTMKLASIERTYSNNGMHYEQAFAYTVTGEIRKHGSLPYNMGSDIPEIECSVKSSAASLMYGRFCKSEIKEEIIEQFFDECPSKRFAYISKEEIAYIMDKEMFKLFVYAFSRLSRESSKRGGYKKVSIKAENKAMLEWLHTHSN